MALTEAEQEVVTRAGALAREQVVPLAALWEHERGP